MIINFLIIIQGHMEILRIENVTKTYGEKDTAVHALDRVSFSVEEGEFVAVTGPSGSGKSTLLHILGGVDKPDSGTVQVKGTDIFRLNETNQAIFRRRQIGLIYQFYNLIPILTVEENILLPLLLDGKKPNPKRLAQILSILGLEDRKEHLPSQLSGGQQQRVSVGRALITHPAVILADEPTGNLDQKNTKEIMDLFCKLNRTYKQTIVMITHDMRLAAQCDRVLAIVDGRLAAGRTLMNQKVPLDN